MFGRIVSRGCRALSPLAALSLLTPAAAQTRAGTTIVNVATLHADAAVLASNPATLTVAERLDVALARSPLGDAALGDGTPAVAVTVTNRGNGAEAFVVAVAVSAGSATLAGAQADGAALVDGRTGPLAPGASVTLLLPVGGASPDAVLAVAVRAISGSGAPGTVFAGAGDGGGDAVVGPTGATAQLSIPLAGVAAATTPTLEKSQAVVAPDGTATPVAGAAITYTLVARFPAATSAADLADVIPAGTVYQPNSLALDGASLADGGHVAGGQVTVPLGPVAAGTTHTLRFTVVIS